MPWLKRPRNVRTHSANAWYRETKSIAANIAETQRATRKSKSSATASTRLARSTDICATGPSSQRHRSTQITEDFRWCSNPSDAFAEVWGVASHNLPAVRTSGMRFVACSVTVSKKQIPRLLASLRSRRHVPPSPRHACLGAVPWHCIQMRRRMS